MNISYHLHISKKILKASIEGISKASDFLDITTYVADAMNEFDGTDRLHLWI